jgi:oligoribonuclease NrnB/cAMP/cGMP phosphodiesterase (DHH superfamily)
MNQIPLVIYHANCWDGFCAAWVARTALGAIEAVPAQYGSHPPALTGREVYVLDFSYPREWLLQMAQEAAHLQVLDHHQTAKEALAGLPWCAFADDKSGGRMTWEYFAGIGGRLGMPAPWLVEYTEDRDLWRHALPHSEAVNAALRSYPLDFDLWDRQFAGAGPPPLSLIQEGTAIRRRERQIVEDHVRNARRENFDGTWTVPIVNATTLFSEIAGELAKGEPFAACYFDRQDGKRQWSLRSDPEGVDVSAIAVAHGGGGHRHAAGFETVLP